jgi:acetyl-CoA carboxylase biotin carboxylase subunit
MLRALGELRVEGVRTTRDFLLKVIDSPAFRAGQLHTRLLEDVLGPRFKGT